MIPQTILLGDRFSVHTVQTDRFKTGMLTLSLTLPSVPEQAVANQLLCGVLRRGTQSYPSAALLNRRLDELYASSLEIKCSKYGKNESMVLSAEMLDDAYVSDSIDLLCDVAQVMAELLFCPLRDEDGNFLASSVEKEKINVIDAVRGVINNPRAYASVRCAEIMNRADTENITMAEIPAFVEGMEASTLRAAYECLLKQSRCSLFYVGSLPSELITTVAERYFSALFDGDALPMRPLGTVAEAEFTRVKETLAVSQGKLVMGWRANVYMGDEKYYAMALMNEILGGSPASKLFLNVRERLGLCYYCSSGYLPYAGVITAGAGIDVKDRETVEREISAQLEQIRRGNVSDVELRAAKQAVAHSYRQIYDNPFEVYSFYAGRMLFGISQTVEECAAAFKAVSKAQIVEAANAIYPNAVYFLEGSECEEADEDER